VYPYSSTTVADPANGMQVDPAQKALEARVQSILAELEQLPPELQLAVYTRLLNGLASKLTAAVAGKALSAARVDPSVAKAKPASKGRATGRKAAAEDVPRQDSLLRQLDDPTDPVEAWQRFGGSAAQLFDVLRLEPTGVLEAMLAHRRMPAGPRPKGKSREKLAEAIAVRLEQSYRGY
jgi:hypothetical protein